MTLVPVRMYFKNGRVKVAISLAKGKKEYDKRETIKRRETDRETRAASSRVSARFASSLVEPMQPAIARSTELELGSRASTRATVYNSACRPVPLLDLQAQYAPLREEILAAITRVCDSQRFIMGPEVDALERAGRCSASAHAIAVSSGTDALLLALMALGIGPGDEVITTTYSFFATAGAIVARRARRRCSSTSTRSTFNLDPAAVSRAITPRTKAILPVHLFGLAPTWIRFSTRRRGRHAGIEDAAQAIGATYNRGRSAARQLGCFSFFPEQEPRRLRRRRAGHHQRPALAARARLLRDARHAAEVLPPRWSAATSGWTRCRRRCCG